MFRGLEKNAGGCSSVDAGCTEKFKKPAAQFATSVARYSRLDGIRNSACNSERHAGRHLRRFGVPAGFGSLRKTVAIQILGKAGEGIAVRPETRPKKGYSESESTPNSVRQTSGGVTRDADWPWRAALQRPEGGGEKSFAVLLTWGGVDL
jgi:hypothetical protein